ncbi:hypothetical protein GS610_21395 [Ruegeria sp. HKCCD6228]|uniref:Uncharacterized protein n=1 Tax=Ruegeria atlantica TaxID=81569 RepID=A0ABX1WHK2_9RHOB|nr:MULTISPECIES: hypothetical protein [Ruegeria]NOD32802.1 hypothetical protein [Ruegeria atlantica]NOD99770.1 hypothetical protein [Ruegeria sp. HKCCD6228]NOE28479.1 hypothetical protein [Ruegeria sp. HKCCD6157]
MTRKRQLNYITFAALMVTTVLGYQTLWGLLFMFWTIPNFYSGHALLLTDVTREEDPILFWLIQLAWVALGLSMIAIDFLPQTF